PCETHAIRRGAWHAARFPPAYVLALHVVLGAVFGGLGLTFATPVMIVVTVLVRALYAHAVSPGPSERARDRDRTDAAAPPSRARGSPAAARGAAGPHG